MKRKFWNWIRDESAQGANAPRTLFLSGEISDTTWFGDEVTPQMFRDELESGSGDITVWINSPGGDVFAAAQIYNMLREYKGAVKVNIDSLAASAASVIAMAGDTVTISPVGMIMIHDPSMLAGGNTRDFEKAIEVLNEVKESIINAYMGKSGLSHKRISDLMSNETWMNAKKAKELGFVDQILFEDESAKKPEEPQEDVQDSEGEGKPADVATAYDPGEILFSPRTVKDSFLKNFVTTNESEGRTPIANLDKRLSLLSH